MNLVYVHGGVSGVTKPSLPELSACVQAALDSSTALDAIERAVRALEDHAELNAGYGSVLNRDGRLELDAAIADGATGRCGGVANVAVRHPISLARRVLRETPHVLVTGAGASALGADMEKLGQSTPEQHRRWSEAAEANRLGMENFASPEHVDTVGAVARDSAGRLAAGSSTGGVFGKLPGRVGDSPVFGAGLYVSGVVAVVGTGVGEAFLETLACLRAGLLVEEGAAPDEACLRVVDALAERAGMSAGLLALDSDARVGAAFNGGSWAVEGPDGPFAAARRGPSGDRSGQRDARPQP
jgi:L-asparaginase / beta-aspartyl-peptidase